MDCTLQIFLDNRWIDCAEIGFDNGFCQWNHEVPYAVEHTNAPLSLAEPVDLDLHPTRSEGCSQPPSVASPSKSKACPTSWRRKAWITTSFTSSRNPLIRKSDN